MANNRRIVCWNLHPEEIRPWRKNEIEYLEVASKAIRDNDPFKRPIWTYDPAHANAKRLSKIAPSVDYLAKGMYTNYAGRKNARVFCRWTIEQEIEAFKLAGKEGIPLALPEMFQQPAEEELEKIPAWVKHDVYLGLVSGAKGIVVFSARKRPKFPAYDTYFNAYVEVGKQLLGPMRLADVFLFGERRNDLLVEVTDGPAEIEFVFASGGVKEPIKYPSLAHLDVALGNDRYLFVVNSANEPVTASIGGMPYNAVRAVSLLDNAEPIDVAEGEFEYRFAPLEVKAFKLERRGK